MSASETIKKLLRRAGNRPGRRNIAFILAGGRGEITAWPHSHIGRYKLDLTNVTKEELELAVKWLAEQGLVEVGGRAVDVTGRSYGVPRDAVVVRNTAFARGVAFAVQNGRLVAYGDPWGKQAAWDELVTLVQDAVKAVKLARGLRHMGYHVQAAWNRQERAIVLVGVEA